MVVGHVQDISSVSDVSSDWLPDRYIPTGDTRFVVLYIYIHVMQIACHLSGDTGQEQKGGEITISAFVL